MYVSTFNGLLVALMVFSCETTALDTGSYENWNFDILDTGIEPTDPSIRIDSQGYPHIAYLREDTATRSKNITYAFYNGSSWQFSTVVENLALKYCFLALDNKDVPHIAFQKGSLPFTINIAIQDQMGWSIDELVPLLYNYSGHLYSIEIGPNGRPHIIYYRRFLSIAEKDLRHLYYTDSAWNNEVAWYFGDGAGCYGVSQAVNSQDVPHLSQYNFWTGYDDPFAPWERLYHSDRSGGRWSGYLIGDCDGHQTDIALTSADLPMIVCQNDTDLLFASFNGSSWHVTYVDPSYEAKYYCAIASDGSDKPHIAYHDSFNHNLMYAWFSGSLNSILLDSDGDVGIDPDIAVDGNGNPFIIYNDITNHQLKLAWFGDSTGVHGQEPGGFRNLSIQDVAPNPARDFLSITLSLADQSTVSISLFDLSGRLVKAAPVAVFTEGLSELSVDVTGLEHGVYIVQASDGHLSEAVLVTVLP